MMNIAATRLVILLGLASAACAPHYAYTFEVPPPSRDPDLAAAIAVDPDTGAIALDLSNRTDQVVQVQWTEISVTSTDGRVTPLHPNADLGWIPPGATISARLFPLALPREGAPAAAYQGRRLDLAVPVIVRREAKQYHYALVAHVREI